MWRDTGRSERSLFSSTIIMTPTPTIGFVIGRCRNSVSARMGARECRDPMTPVRRDVPPPRLAARRWRWRPREVARPRCASSSMASMRWSRSLDRPTSSGSAQTAREVERGRRTALRPRPRADHFTVETPRFRRRERRGAMVVRRLPFCNRVRRAAGQQRGALARGAPLNACGSSRRR